MPGHPGGTMQQAHGDQNGSAFEHERPADPDPAPAAFELDLVVAPAGASSCFGGWSVRSTENHRFRYWPIHRRHGPRVHRRSLVASVGINGMVGMVLQPLGCNHIRHFILLRPGLQLIRVPGRDVLSRPGRAHRSPSTAARSMPWDSIPISLAGFRLATMMTWRPTRSSGR